MTGQQDPLRRCTRGATDFLALVEEEGSMDSHLQQARAPCTPGNLAPIPPLDLQRDILGLFLNCFLWCLCSIRPYCSHISELSSPHFGVSGPGTFILPLVIVKGSFEPQVLEPRDERKASAQPSALTSVQTTTKCN